MISPEILRRYPLFSELDDAALKAIAMISDEVSFAKGDTIYETGKPNSYVYLLEEGCIESYLVVEDPNNKAYHKEYYLDDIDLGEVFGVSALIEPKMHTTTARGSRGGKFVRISGVGLESLSELNPRLGYILMRAMAGHLLYRLEQDRIQLAACR